MEVSQIVTEFVEGIKQTTWLEYIAVFAGIGSVWFSKKENIWVYPVGLINTTIYIYLSLSGHLFGEASVNFYYTVMSIYGWWLWTRTDDRNRHIVVITSSSRKEWFNQIIFFLAFYIVIYFSLTAIKKSFAPGAVPWADALASAAAYTGMWLMAKKKVESWIWWIVTNIASIPLYFVKGFVFTSVYYFILLILAILGWLEWNRKKQTTLVPA